MAGGRWILLQPATDKERELSGECLQFLSTQNEKCETRRARGDFQLVNRSRMVSLSRADKKKKKCKIIIVIKNKNVLPNILGRPLIYLGSPPR